MDSYFQLLHDSVCMRVCVFSCMFLYGECMYLHGGTSVRLCMHTVRINIIMCVCVCVSWLVKTDQDRA